MGTSKEALISALASAMGQGAFADTKYAESRYDSSTGTLFCQGYIISRSTINDALEYFRKAKAQADKLAETEPAMRNTALYYQTAIEAIAMMQKKITKNGGRLIAEKDNALKGEGRRE